VIGQAIHWADLALAFLLELCALVALGYWGVRAGHQDGTGHRVLAIAFVLLVAVNSVLEARAVELVLLGKGRASDT
jgi:Protein of unknown function (DUF2568)